MKLPEKYSVEKVVASYDAAESDRSEWVAEWRNISDYLVPGRGIYTRFTKPSKRSLTSRKVVNPAGSDALYVLTSGMHSGLTSPSRPWMSMNWADKDIRNVHSMRMWMADSTDRMLAGFSSSNFYSLMNSFYVELCGFGTGCMYIGSDSDSPSAPFRFEILTAGEYLYSMSSNGMMNTFFRVLHKTPRQVVEDYPDTADSSYVDEVKNNRNGADVVSVVLLEYVVRDDFSGKPVSRAIYDITGSNLNTPIKKDVLKVDGFYEFPYVTARWDIIGGDTYGIGPGSRALPDIMRLQEMESSMLMAAHKELDPPVLAPSRFKGKLKTTPGAKNYRANENDKVEKLYDMRFDIPGVDNVIGRIEDRIRRGFFNDIFLTASRDPNASPLKAAQVTVQEQEKMLRLGPVIERMQHEFLYPLVDRCFGIMHRDGWFQEMSPEMEDLADDYVVTMISPLATAQRGVALNGIQSFLGFIGQAAQFGQEVVDKVNIDLAVDEWADITGVSPKILRSDEEVQSIRQKRAEAMAEQRKKEEGAAMAAQQSAMSAESATAQKAQSEAGLNLLEGQQLVQDMGVL